MALTFAGNVVALKCFIVQFIVQCLQQNQVTVLTMPTADNGIQEVWHSNLEDEFRKIRAIVQKYPYVAMVIFFLFGCVSKWSVSHVKIFLGCGLQLWIHCFSKWAIFVTIRLILKDVIWVKTLSPFQVCWRLMWLKKWCGAMCRPFVYIIKLSEQNFQLFRTRNFPEL